MATPIGKPVSEKWPLKGGKDGQVWTASVLTKQTVQWIKDVQCCADSATE